MLNCFLIDPLHSPEDGFPALGRHCLLRPHRVRRGLIPRGGGGGGARRGGPGRACSHARPRVASAPRAADAVCAPTRAGFALRPFTRGGGTGAINACCSLGKGPFGGGWGGVAAAALPGPSAARPDPGRPAGPAPRPAASRSAGTGPRRAMLAAACEAIAPFSLQPFGRLRTNTHDLSICLSGGGHAKINQTSALGARPTRVARGCSPVLAAGERAGRISVRAEQRQASGNPRRLRPGPASRCPLDAPPTCPCPAAAVGAAG